jgi:SulP family sulfate permease
MIDLIISKQKNLTNELLSGLTVALALVPEAVAFAFVAGVDPSVGLWAAFFVGLITSLFGGRPGMISGATGAMAVVMTAFVVLYGLEYLFAGVIIAALVFAWEKSKQIHAEARTENGTKIYELKGPLFFGAITHFKEIFSPADDPEEVIAEFRTCRVYDHSALEAIHAISEKYREQGKRLRLKHLSKECQTLLERAGDIIDVDIHEDPDYHIAINRITN